MREGAACKQGGFNIPNRQSKTCLGGTFQGGAGFQLCDILCILNGFCLHTSQTGGCALCLFADLFQHAFNDAHTLQQARTGCLIPLDRCGQGVACFRQGIGSFFADRLQGF